MKVRNQLQGYLYIKYQSTQEMIRAYAIYLGMWVAYINNTMESIHQDLLVAYIEEKRSQRNPWVMRSNKEEWNLVK